MIEVKNLTKKYGSQLCLDDMSFSLPEGHVCGIVGENGAGKSTLFRCLNGLESFDGEVIIPQGLSMGFLMDTQYFYSYVTGREYVEFCLKASKKDSAIARIDEMNSVMGLPLEKYASRYSLGMKKRLALLALMLQEHDVIVMDEPFNGLDLIGTIVLKRWIREQRDKGRTVLLSSHIISSLTEICDTIHYIHAGKLLKSFNHATPDEIEATITMTQKN